MASKQKKALKTPLAFGQLEREVQLARKLVANPNEAKILIEGLHDEEIKLYKETESKKFDQNVVAPVRTFVMSELKKAEQFLVPGSGIMVVPSEMKEKAKILQSLAGSLMASAIKLDNHAKGIKFTPKPTGKPNNKPSKPYAKKNMGTDPEVMAEAVRYMETNTASETAKKYKVSRPTLYVWRKKLESAAAAAQLVPDIL